LINLVSTASEITENFDQIDNFLAL